MGKGAFKDYFFYDSLGVKRKAEAEVKRLRKQGYRARIERVRAYSRGRKWNYTIWIKEK